ncbi:MAG TPA: hypothetical protein VI299_13825 [Polyangiales bacterium]
MRLVRSASSISREPAPRWLLVGTLAFSLLAHALVLLASSVFLKPPELDLEFALPIDVELGTAEGLTVAPPASSASQPPTDPSTTAQGAAKHDDVDGGVGDAAIADASSEDARVPDAGAHARDAGHPDAAARTEAADAGPAVALAGDAGVTRMPPGAQIALRVDMTRIRNSPVAPDVRRLLAAIPDWKALLDGSGIDPLSQLDRLLLATPNLQREKIVLAGRYLGGEQVVREAVARLGQARGVPTPWRSLGNVQVAPWANVDATARTIALIGPAHFAIAREEDLPRILAIASARAKGKKKAASTHPADALLSMEENEGLSIEVEGAANFVRKGRRGVPDHLRLSATELPRLRAELRGVLSYNDEATATDALDYVRTLRDRYASNALVALMGLSDPLEDAEIVQSERELHVKVTLTAEQLRLILGYLRELFTPAGAAP